MNAQQNQSEQLTSQESATRRRRNIFGLACCAIVNTVAAREVYWNMHNHVLAYVLGGVAIASGALATLIYLYGGEGSGQTTPAVEKTSDEPAVASAEDSEVAEDPKVD